MSQVFTAKQICERSLRAIGAFPITDSSADGEQMREAMTYLDLLMAEIAGTGTLFFLHTATLDVAIVNGTQSYNLNNALGTDLPVDRVQFPLLAWLEDAAGNRSPIEIVTRAKFEDVTRGDTSGKPYWIYIDRLASPTPTLEIYPTPATTDATVYTIKIEVQTYAPNVAPHGVTGVLQTGVLHNFRQAWQRYLILRLNVDLGMGPILKCSEDRLRNWRGEALTAKTALEAFENRPHDTEPPIAEAWEGADAVCWSADYGNKWWRAR